MKNLNSNKSKKYLIQLEEDNDLDLGPVNEGDIIEFEMPSFVSGEFSAVIKCDDKGLYIDKDDDYFETCRDYIIKSKL